MGNLYRLNSLFELEIAKVSKYFDLDKPLMERNTAFEYLFLFLSKPEDYTLMSESPSEELIEYWGKNKIPIGKTIQMDTPYFAKELKLKGKIAKGTKLIEWGRTSTLNSKEGKLEKKNHIITFSNFLNSKINQTRWKESQYFNSLTSLVCSNKQEISYVTETINYPVVIKTEFGFSGRGQTILNSKEDLKEYSKNYYELFRLNPSGVIVEEWVGERKIQDFSGIFDLSRKVSGLVTMTKMLVGKNGTYQGSIIQKDFGKEFENQICNIIVQYTRNRSAYKGTASIDGFSFRREKNVEVQYMSEINFRYSMGRVLYELHNKFDANSDEYALLFFPVRSKNITFKSLVSGLTKIKSEFKSEVLLATPLANASGKINQFLGFYVSNKKKFPKEIIDSIKKLLL